MASIETYQERINTLKTSIETLKSGGAVTIGNLPGRAPLKVRKSWDLHLPCGTVIAGGDTRVYLRVPHGDIYWASASTDVDGPDNYNLDGFYDFLRARTAGGEQFRIVYQPEA